MEGKEGLGRTFSRDPETSTLWVHELDPNFGFVDRPASRIETAVHRGKEAFSDLVRQAAAAFGITRQ